MGNVNTCFPPEKVSQSQRMPVLHEFEIFRGRHLVRTYICKYIWISWICICILNCPNVLALLLPCKCNEQTNEASYSSFLSPAAYCGKKWRFFSRRLLLLLRWGITKGVFPGVTMAIAADLISAEWKYEAASGGWTRKSPSERFRQQKHEQPASCNFHRSCSRCSVLNAVSGTHSTPDQCFHQSNQLRYHNMWCPSFRYEYNWKK